MSIEKFNKSNPLLGEAQLQAVSELFSVLSEPNRLKILQILHDGSATVGQIMQATGLKQANASKQLSLLHQAGVLDRQKDGITTRYSIRLPLVLELCDLVCAGLQREARAKARELGAS
ncbi:MAG: winged helix-turn-helix transcriptional regulator [Phycisphaerales bacterium]|nr:winged helix-turn-helix transcriptional regulator [Phycisphaerales bacterium]